MLVERFENAHSKVSNSKQKGLKMDMCQLGLGKQNDLAFTSMRHHFNTNKNTVLNINMNTCAKEKRRVILQ